LEKVEGYNILTNKINLPSKDSTEFKKAKNGIEQYLHQNRNTHKNIIGITRN
ncbi:hypothetical protein NEIRO03_1961, partial [Nematocida sp. AWRm78]